MKPYTTITLIVLLGAMLTAGITHTARAQYFVPIHRGDVSFPSPEAESTAQALLANYKDRFRALMSTGMYREHQGDLPAALACYQQAKALAEDTHRQQQLYKDVLERWRLMQQDPKEYGSLFVCADPEVSPPQEDIEPLTRQYLGKECHFLQEEACEHLGHVCCLMGRYRQALEALGSCAYLTEDAKLDKSVAFYRLGEDASALKELAGSDYGVYIRRTLLRKGSVSRRELGVQLLTLWSSVMLGERWFLRMPPTDISTSGLWPLALHYTEEAYKLMPNNLDVCLQYYVLLCSLKRYQQAIELYRHMYALVIKGPSAYVTAQGQITTLPAYLVPHEEWEAWKRAHGGRDAYPIPVFSSTPSKP